MNPVNSIIEGQERVLRSEEPEKTIEISVVVPISERHDDLRDLYIQYSKELSIHGESYEFIFVLDGYDSEALETLKGLKKEYPKIKVLTLNRRFGEATALSVGFEKAKGSVILTLPAYFQVEPAEMHKIIKKFFENEHDMIISWRHPRIDSLFNRLQSWAFHGLVRSLTGMSYHDITCGLRAMRRRVAEEIPLYGDLHRFFPLLAYQRGFKIKEVCVQQSPLDAKPRVYQPGVYLRRLLDILTLFFVFKFTKKPLRFFGLIGSVLFGIGGAITGYLGVYRILDLGPIAGRPLLILGVLLMVLGVQLFSIGLLGEIVIFTHARDVKDYQIKEILD
jgi:glycosyltransferase involved in cell wall biosynthesis